MPSVQCFSKEDKDKKDVEISVADYTSKNMTFHDSEGLYVGEKREALSSSLSIFSSQTRLMLSSSIYQQQQRKQQVEMVIDPDYND
nr:3776_t:CDS:2 [Entrophospora candida]